MNSSASFLLLRCLLWRLASHCRIEWNWLVANRELRDYLEADVVVDLSGDMLTEDYGAHVAYSHYLPLLFTIMLRRPLYLCAQSIGPFKLTRPLARWIFNNATRITLRDEISYDYLKEIGVNADLLERTADMAFLLSAIQHDQAEAVLAKEGYTAQTGRRLVGVSLSRLVEKKYARLNPLASEQSFVSMMAKALDDLAFKHELDFLFIPHVTGPADAKDDRKINAEVSASMKTQGKCVLANDYLPSEIKGLIGLCDAMIGARMHANIAALSSEIPTVAIAYSHKTPGIMEMLGQLDYVIGIESISPTIVQQKFETVLNNHEDIKNQLRQALIKVRQDATSNIEIARKILDDNPALPTNQSAQ